MKVSDHFARLCRGRAGLCLTAGLVSQSGPQSPRSVPQRAERQPAEAAYGSLPLSFEVNQGQAAAQVKFLSRGKGYTLLLTSSDCSIRARSSARGSRRLPMCRPACSRPTPMDKAWRRRSRYESGPMARKPMSQWRASMRRKTGSCQRQLSWGRKQTRCFLSYSAQEFVSAARSRRLQPASAALTRRSRTPARRGMGWGSIKSMCASRAA